MRNTRKTKQQEQENSCVWFVWVAVKGQIMRITKLQPYIPSKAVFHSIVHELHFLLRGEH